MPNKKINALKINVSFFFIFFACTYFLYNCYVLKLYLMFATLKKNPSQPYFIVKIFGYANYTIIKFFKTNDTE